VGTAGVVAPNPVQNTSTVSPGAAGALPVTSVPRRFTIAPWPDEFIVKMPGEADTIVTACGVLLFPARVTTTFLAPEVVSNGIWMLITSDETKKSGAAVPPTVTESTSARLVGSGVFAACADEPARLLPKMVAIEPRDNDPLEALGDAKLALLTIPFAATAGVDWDSNEGNPTAAQRKREYFLHIPHNVLAQTEEID
jgi:hypothetical protein